MSGHGSVVGRALETNKPDARRPAKAIHICMRMTAARIYAHRAHSALSPNNGTPGPTYKTPQSARQGSGVITFAAFIL